MTRSASARPLTACLSAARSLLGTLCLWLLVLNAPPAAAQNYTFGTLAGLAGSPGTNDAPGSAARFKNPSGVAVDSAGNVYVADTDSHTIRKVTPAGVVTTLAGLALNPGTNDATSSNARFKNPYGVAVDSAGNVYVADTSNHTIRKVTPGGVVTTLAGLAGSWGINDGPGSAARFKHPHGVAVDSAGNVYVGDTSNHTIRKVTPGGVVTTLAGLAGSPGINDGPGSIGRFKWPHGVAVDSVGNVYVADYGNQAIRKVSSAGLVYTLAGAAGFIGTTDAMGSLARFYGPSSVGVDSAGNVYVADTVNHKIRKVTPAEVVTTIGGLAGSFGTSDGTGSEARFRKPAGIAVDSAGKVYVADTVNHTIRLTGDFPPVITSASTAPGHVGQAFSYQIMAINSPTDFNATGLPAGLSVNLTTGLISGTPTVAGPSTVALSANNTNGTGVRALLITTAPLTPPVITSASTAAGMVSYTFSYQITASNSPTSFNAIGLPAGLSIDPTTGLISGTPTVAGTAGVSLSASNMDGTGFDALLITTAAAPVAPPVITSASTAAGNVGYTFSYQITAINSPTGFNATGLPAGLSINPINGFISGTPTVAGTSTVTLSAANAVGTGVATLLITTTVIPPVITSGSSAAVTVGYAFSYQITAINSPTSFNATGLPAGLSINPTTGLISGTPTVTGTTSASLSASNVGGTGVATLLITVVGSYTFTTLTGLALNPGSTDATGSAARFNYPHGVAVDSAGNVYVADGHNHTIRQVTPAGVVTTLAGLALNPGTTDGTGSAARFNYPNGVAVDSAGNVYVSDTYNHTIRKVTPGGVVTTLAGLAGSTGTNDAPGSGARFNYPQGMAVDSAGNVYVGDKLNHAIRKVTPGGVVTTLAGLAGSFGSSDGTGSAARFNGPNGVSVDSAGNVYVADSGNHTIRKVTSGGVVTTLAVPGTNDGTGSIFPGFFFITDVAVDSAGNVYVRSSESHTIRKMTSAGVVTTIGGLDFAFPGSDDGTGSAARFNNPLHIAVDSAGNVYVADTFNHTIRRTYLTPVITSASTAVGMVGQAFSYQITADNSPTGFNATGLPAGLVVNPVTGLISGTPTVAGTTSASLSASNVGGTGVGTLLITVGLPVIPQNYTFTTLAGLALNTGSTDATGSAARLNYPHGVAVDTKGNVYVADTFNHTIRLVTLGGTVSTVAGLTGVSGTNDGTGSAAQFNNPRGVAVDSAGNVYVADSGNHTIRKVTSAGVVSTLAGLALSSGNTDGTGSAARFDSLEGVAVDGVGNVYVGDTFNHTIRMVTPAGVVTTLAGTAGSIGSTDGTGSAARFNFPYGVAVDSAGNVYVADLVNNTIRKVTPGGVMAPGWVVTTLAGLAGSLGSSDGTGSAARFDHPYGVAVDNAGSVYVADADNNTIRKVTSVGVVTTLGGLAGVSGSADGTGIVARFNYPRGMAVDSAGNVYVGDTFNHTIRKGVPTAAVSPPVITSASTATAKVGQDFSFQITANNSPTSFNATGLPGGLSINLTTGLISGTPTVAGTYSVSLSARNTDGTISAALLITVNLMNQTITFGSLVNMDVGNAPFMVNAMASSGLPVSFSIVSGPCRQSGANQITLTGVGLVTVRAFQTGNANYKAATPVDQSFSVSGMIPVVRVEAFADLAGGFQRNKDFHLTLRVRPSNNVQNYSVEETVPLGWTVKLDSISHGGKFDGTSRKLQWGPFFDTLERACACVLEPGDNTGPAVFTGGVRFDVMFDSATGLQTSGVFVPFTESRMVARGAILLGNANVGRNIRTDGFRLLVLGEAGMRYDIEACSTPTIPGSWVPVAINLDGSALLDFTDSLATSSTRRFYRVIER